MRAFILVPVAFAIACGSASVELDTAGASSLATYEEEEVCPDQSNNLIAGQHIDAGGVRITNDDVNLYVEISTQDGWLLTETHVFAGTGEVPANRKGTPVPGLFPYAQSFSPGVTSTTVVIPLAGLGVDCDDTLKVAVHAVVERHVGDVVEEETAWGDGVDFATPRWAWSTLYTGCCEPLSPDECIEPVEYWAGTDPATWTHDITDWPFCWSEETGAISAAEIMQMAPTTFYLQLSQQFLAAYLNQTCAGSDCVIGPAITHSTWLTGDCVLDESELAEAEELYALFVSFNTRNYQRPIGGCDK
ncbi:MAG: hypothetical protein A2138_15830 [Deltaproteobacteria bacterium RBG_16_71_12]|nr:MAG: hypothetical protein A2138_15830 [Deltaproteobacteria bacterium RBG_16_71_12]